VVNVVATIRKNVILIVKNSLFKNLTGRNLPFVLNFSIDLKCFNFVIKIGPAPAGQNEQGSGANTFLFFVAEFLFLSHRHILL
jgi:hypothetical protein